MTSEINRYDLSEENFVVNDDLVQPKIKNLSQNLLSLDKDFIVSSNKLNDLKVNIEDLKNEIKSVIEKINHDVEHFKTMLSETLENIVHILSDKELHIDMTLDECYKIIGGLVETFLSIGYDSEKNINALSTKLGKIDEEIKSVSKSLPMNEFNCDNEEKFWFINDKFQLTLRENVPVGSVLPKFESGNTTEREQFLSFMLEVFGYYKIPEGSWVRLITHQLINSARVWWHFQTYKNLTWLQFTKLFINASFHNDDVITFNGHRKNCINESDRSLLTNICDEQIDLNNTNWQSGITSSPEEHVTKRFRNVA